jgi:ABC-type glycerol-3-phosphate transport system substrate-binding protein
MIVPYHEKGRYQMKVIKKIHSKTQEMQHKQRKIRLIYVGMLAICFFLAACGKKESEADIPYGIDGYVYKASFERLEAPENTYTMAQTILGDTLYYILTDYSSFPETQKLVSRPLVGEEAETVTALALEEGEMINALSITAQGEPILLLSVYDQETYEPSYSLAYLDAQGKLLNQIDLDFVDSNRYMQNLTVDEQGRAYLIADNTIFLVDAQGSYHGQIDVNGYLYAIAIGADQKVYATYSSDTGIETPLCEVDFSSKSLTTIVSDFRMDGSQSLMIGPNGGFLRNNGGTLYELDLETKVETPILRWIESDITQYKVNTCKYLSDGAFVVLIDNWNDTGSWTELAYLTKTAVGEMPQRETIQLAMFYYDDSMMESVVGFNKTNEQYRVVVKSYYDSMSEDYENAYKDARMAMNQDITSGSGIDLLEISNIDFHSLAERDVFEDLYLYLDSSEIYNRDDFVESLLRAYTIDEQLISIPPNFTLNVFAGKKSVFGERDSWTIDDMIGYMDEYPDAQLFSYANNAAVLQMFAMMNIDQFVEPATGKCHFDSDEFKKYMELANRFPTELDYPMDAPSDGEMLLQDDVLLISSYISDVRDYQMITAQVHGEPLTFLGFPTSDGSSGMFISGSNGAYAMMSKGDQKDGAWAFIEYYLSNSADSTYSWGFSSLKESLERKFSEASTPQYRLDENGNQVEISVYGIGFGNGEQIDIYAAKPQEIEELRKLIDRADQISPAGGGQDEIFAIILEEAAAYFEGQKTVDEVADIIQRRVQVYVDENQ